MTISDLLTTKKAAEMLGVSDQTVINWWRDGLFPNAFKANPRKKNSKLLIPRKDVDQAKLAQKQAARG